MRADIRTLQYYLEDEDNWVNWGMSSESAAPVRSPDQRKRQRGATQEAHSFLLAPFAALRNRQVIHSKWDGPSGRLQRGTGRVLRTAVSGMAPCWADAIDTKYVSKKNMLPIRSIVGHEQQ
jgi:hypothetical protein